MQAFQAVRDREEQRQQRSDGQHDGADAGRHVLQRPVEAAVRAREAEQSIGEDERERPAAWELEPERSTEDPEDDRREAEAEPGAPERVELAVAVADTDEVRTADDDGGDERAEREPVRLGRAAAQSARRPKTAPTGVLRDGVAADVRDVERLDEHVAAELAHAGDGGVRVLGAEDRRPVGRHRAHLGSQLDHSGDAAAVDLQDAVDLAAAHVGFADVVAENVSVEGGRALGVGGQVLVPHERAGLGRELGADVLLRLPDAEDGAGRILREHHAAGVEDVHRRHEEGAAGVGDARCGGVDVVGRDVGRPVRRHAFAAGRRRARGGDVLAVLREHRVAAGLGTRVALGLPAEQVAVEGGGAVEIGGRHVRPAGRAGRVLGELGHDGSFRSGQPWRRRARARGSPARVALLSRSCHTSVTAVSAW